MKTQSTNTRNDNFAGFLGHPPPQPNPPLLERVLEHRNRGWDGFRFFLKPELGLVIICSARPEYEITSLPSTYKYLLPLILSSIPLLF